MLGCVARSVSRFRSFLLRSPILSSFHPRPPRVSHLLSPSRFYSILVDPSTTPSLSYLNLDLDMSANTSETHAQEQKLAQEFLNFVNASPSQFHAVGSAVSQLTKAGFQPISERDDAQWAAIKPNGKYFFTRNQSTVIAFAVGSEWKKGCGFTITAAHTDSSVLKVKPVSKTTKHGYLQVGVECYGGGLWNTWFDRDLSVAGRVIVSKGDTYEVKLVHIKRPILRIPNLAIHLNRDVNDKGFAPNKQSHVLPILATAVKSQLDGPKTEEKKENSTQSGVIADEHQPLFLNIIATELGIDVSSIRDFELCLYDTQPAIIGGALNEFIYSRALDNLMMSFVSLKALIDSSSVESLKGESTVRMVALFDNEEIGSASVNGAASNMMSQLLARINGDYNSYDSAIRRSFLVSADMAHALHPNYAEVHEENHRPQIHKGLVLKNNANLRYATNAISSFLISEIARKSNIPLQKFAVRNDMGCGSTIGPILAANCGIRTVDVGIPQLAMHSIREMCGVGDVYQSYLLLHRVYHDLSALDASLKVQYEQ